MSFDPRRAWFGMPDYVGASATEIIPSDSAFDAVNPSPVRNIKDRLTYRMWRSGSASDYFVVDFGRDRTIQHFALAFARITNPMRADELQEIAPTDTIRHRLDADGGTAGAGAALDTGAVPGRAWPNRGYSVTALSAPVTARYWRCDIDAPSRAAPDYFLVALAMAGPVFQPAYNHAHGDVIGFADNSELQRTPISRSTFAAINERTLFFRGSWDFIPDPERAQWHALDDYCGATEPFVFAVGDDAAGAFASVAGPSGYVCDGASAFVALNAGEAGVQSRTRNANIRTLTLEEHR